MAGESLSSSRPPDPLLARLGQQLPGDHARAVTDGARGAGDADRGAGHGVYVAPDAERIADVLALELHGELRRLDREVAVRLGVVRDDDAREHAGHVHADENVNRTVIAVFLRHEVGRPEGNAERRRRRTGFWVSRVRREVERFTG